MHEDVLLKMGVICEHLAVAGAQSAAASWKQLFIIGIRLETWYIKLLAYHTLRNMLSLKRIGSQRNGRSTGSVGQETVIHEINDGGYVPIMLSASDSIRTKPNIQKFDRLINLPQLLVFLFHGLQALCIFVYCFLSTCMRHLQFFVPQTTLCCVSQTLPPQLVDQYFLIDRPHGISVIMHEHSDECKINKCVSIVHNIQNIRFAILSDNER